MPRKYTKKTKKYSKKRRYKKRGFSTKAPVPMRFPTKMRYCEGNAINPGLAGSIDVIVFSANGLYDPNITGTGHQPRGFDQLMALYDHYVVAGSKCRVQFAGTQTGTGNTGNIKIGISLLDSPTPFTSALDYLESGSTVSRLMKGDTSSEPVSLSMKASVSKYLGRSKILSDSQLKGSTAANPTEQLYFHIWAEPFNAVDVSPIDLNVLIDYLVVLIEPKVPTVS